MNRKKIPLFYVLLCAVSLNSCTSTDTDLNRKQAYTINYVFFDITGDEENNEILKDNHLSELVSSVGWDKGGDVFNGAMFRVFTLSNLNMTQSVDLELKMGKTGFNGQPGLARQRDVDRFIQDKLKPELKDFASKVEKGKEESEIYANLCKQLSNLSKLSADKKNVVIYSDMLENSKLFSFYGNNNVSPDSFKNAEKFCKFPDLSDINIYIVPPLNPKNKDLISKSDKAWSSFFASKNAKSFHFDVNLKIE